MIQITEKIFIDADDTQFIVKELGTVQDKNSKNYGKETYTTLGYFGDTASAVNWIVKDLTRRKIKHTTLTLKQVVDEIRKLQEQITDVLKEEII